MKKKEYNCPDCKVWLNTCEGCQRYYEKEKDKESDSTHPKETDSAHSIVTNDLVNRGYRDYKDLFDYSFVRDYATYSSSACENCPNNPKNGGTGVCSCTVPYFESPTAGKYDGLTTAHTTDTKLFGSATTETSKKFDDLSVNDDEINTIHIPY